MTSIVDLALGLSLVAAPVCAAGLALAPSRRIAVALLMGVFLGCGAGIGFGQQLRIGLGLVATGAVACGILALGLERSHWPARREGAGPAPVGRVFRGATVALVAAAAWGLSAPYVALPGPVSSARLTAAVMTVAMGLLQLGLSQEQGAAALGLLTALAGFEVFYAGLEPSLALRAVLAAIMIGIALVSSMLLEAPPPQREERDVG
ncbi:MAG TPA: hypothetical protein VK449_01560 [Anaerolineales bacterium]|nr:hypothetical protein [Anaerolineales bacterium]